MGQTIKVPLGALTVVPVEELTPIEEQSVTKPHPEATIGPTPETAPVTLGDLIDNPSVALKRIVAITKKGLSDPRNTIPAAVGLAAGALGLTPRSFASTRGLSPNPATVPPPAPPTKGLAQALKENVALDDVIGAIPGAHTLKSGYRVGRGVQRAIQQTGRTTVPPEPLAAPPTTPTTPVPSAPTAATPEASAPSTGETAFPSFAELALTDAEITTAAKWFEQGVSPEMILHRILQSRQLTARTRTTTPDQAAEAIRYRNAKGRWQDER